MPGTSDGFLNRAWIFCSELGCAYNVLYISLILRQAKDREGGGIYTKVVLWFRKKRAKKRLPVRVSFD